MLFKYQAKNKSGQEASGVIEAASKNDVARILRQKNYFILNIAPAGRFFNFSNIKLPFQGVSFNDIVNFTRQLSTMIVAGLPLIESLRLLQNQAIKSSLKSVLGKVVKRIEGGEPLSRALFDNAETFSMIYTSSIRAGETSGKLDAVFERLADNLEKERDFRGKIKGAMIYPVIILIGMSAMIFLMMTLVVPKLAEFFESFQLELPVTTKMLIFTAKIFANFWWLILFAIFALFFLFSSWKRSDAGRIVLDKVLFRLPLWGSLRKEMMVSEIARTMALLVESGVPILEGLQIVADAVESRMISSGIKEAAVKVEKGAPLGASFKDNPIFPPLLSQMIIVGEETGKLDETLYRVSKFYETSAAEKVKVLTTAIEPIIIVILGIGVAFVVLSIVLPMYQLTQAM